MLWVAFLLVVLHGPDGREIDVSIDEITSLQCKRPGVKNQLFTEGVNTVINMTDGKYISVRETCAEIHDLVHEKQNEGTP
jgi:hypothetical protein